MEKEFLNMSLDEAMTEYVKGRCGYVDMVDYLTANEKESAELFRRAYITDKAGILKSIDIQRKIWEDVQEDGRVHTPQYYDRLFSLLSEFQEDVEDSYLFDELPDWWAYSIYVDTNGIYLRMDYYADNMTRPHLVLGGDMVEPVVVPDETFILIKTEAKLLKVEEYAALFDVDPPAVRQWIRRGKLPSAIKYGREWRIPELCDVGGRNYTSRSYCWKTELPGLPESYEFLNNYSAVTLERNQRDKKTYKAYFWSLSDDLMKELDMKEREQLEMILISNPFVNVEYECLAHITRRSGQGVYLIPFDGSDDNEFLRGSNIEKK